MTFEIGKLKTHHILLCALVPDTWWTGGGKPQVLILLVVMISSHQKSITNKIVLILCTSMNDIVLSIDNWNTAMPCRYLKKKGAFSIAPYQ